MQDKATPLLRNVIQFDIAFFRITIHRNNCRPTPTPRHGPHMGYCLFYLNPKPVVHLQFVYTNVYTHIYIYFSADLQDRAVGSLESVNLIMSDPT